MVPRKVAKMCKHAHTGCVFQTANVMQFDIRDPQMSKSPEKQITPFGHVATRDLFFVTSKICNLM
jgi:hypothetical protein